MLSREGVRWTTLLDRNNVVGFAITVVVVVALVRPVIEVVVAIGHVKVLVATGRGFRGGRPRPSPAFQLRFRLPSSGFGAGMTRP